MYYKYVNYNKHLCVAKISLEFILSLGKPYDIKMWGDYIFYTRSKNESGVSVLHYFLEKFKILIFK